MKASSDLLTPGDVVQCSKPTDTDQHRKDEILGTVVYVEHKGWLSGLDVEGTRAAWYQEYQQAWQAGRGRVRVACRRERGEPTTEALHVLALVAYKTVIWAPKETPNEIADRLAARDRWKAEAARAFVAGLPQPPQPQGLPAWKVEPFTARPNLRRWYFATLPPGAQIRAARGPEHAKAERAKARARRNRQLWLRKQREAWQQTCHRAPPLTGVKPKFRRPPVRRAWALASVTQHEQLEIGVAA